MRPTRRNALAGVAALPVLIAPWQSGAAGPDFSIRAVQAQARILAARPFRPLPTAPAAWAELSFDRHRAVRPRPDRPFWADKALGMTAEALPPGYLFDEGPRLFLLGMDGEASERRFAAGLFDFGSKAPASLAASRPAPTFFSGMRLRTAGDEFAVFQGATYFRAIGLRQVFGLSARAVVVGTTQFGHEQFPVFRKLWLEPPTGAEAPISLHGLFDCPALAGSFHAAIRPGAATTMEASVFLSARRAVADIGIAPLTSMFLFDATNRARFDDYRSGAHDSNGLAWDEGAERVWRPLANPSYRQVNEFRGNSPAGFGLAQRARAFDRFGDLALYYERRPSAWVAPQGDWGRGVLVLVELPTEAETDDNIVAYWRPSHGLEAGETREYRYRLTWSDCDAKPPGLAAVARTRIGADAQGGMRIAIDFGETAATNWHVSVNRGLVVEPHLLVNAALGGQRLTFRFEPGEHRSVELRAGLAHADGRPASETWLYRWTR